MPATSTSTPFAYNPTGGNIPGTEQVGDLAIGWPTSGFDSTGLEWWNGPNEDNGYVIAKPKSGDDQPTPLFYTPSDGSKGWMTLSTTYRGTDIYLSNNYQRAYQQFGYQQSVLCNTLIDNQDKVMLSVRLSLIDPPSLPGSHFVGIGTRSMNYQGNPYGAFPGNDEHSIGYGSDGYIWYNGSIQATVSLLTFSGADTIDIAINNNINVMWVRVNGGYWNNQPDEDPVTNSKGIEIIGGPFYPVLCPGYEGTMTIQNTPTFGVPDGYTLLGTNVTASVGFSRTDGFDDTKFIQDANTILSSNYTNAIEASTALTNNGYWNSYPVPVLSLDAGNPSSYPGSGTVWTDLIGGKTFNLINSPNYGAGFGGFLSFNTGSGQYAECATSLSNLNTWSVGIWHFYDGTNAGSNPCIITEVYPGSSGQINYSIGNNTGAFSSGFFDGGWKVTDGYSLTPGSWYFILGTYDGATVKLYINNTLVGSDNYTGTPISSQGGIRLMSRWDNPEFWGGLLSIVGIYDKALNTSQIASIWNLNKARFGL
jgi:hypothetical protein